MRRGGSEGESSRHCPLVPGAAPLAWPLHACAPRPCGVCDPDGAWCLRLRGVPRPRPLLPTLHSLSLPWPSCAPLNACGWPLACLPRRTSPCSRECRPAERGGGGSAVRAAGQPRRGAAGCAAAHLSRWPACSPTPMRAVPGVELVPIAPPHWQPALLHLHHHVPPPPPPLTGPPTGPTTNGTRVSLWLWHARPPFAQVSEPATGGSGRAAEPQAAAEGGARRRRVNADGGGAVGLGWGCSLSVGSGPAGTHWPATGRRTCWNAGWSRERAGGVGVGGGACGSLGFRVQLQGVIGCAVWQECPSRAWQVAQQ